MPKQKPNLNQADITLLRKFFATKDDLKGLATKQDVSSILLGDNLKALKNIVGLVIDEKGLVTRDDVKHLPTKDEFYKANDKLMKEIKASREDSSAYSAQVKRLADKVELHHPTN